MASYKAKKLAAAAVDLMPEGTKIVAQLKSPDGDSTGPPLSLPGDATPEQLQLLLNQLLNQVCPEIVPLISLSMSSYSLNCGLER